MSLATTIKSIQDIMRKDVGVDGDAQRIGQLVWLLFLKIWDDRERELELIEDDFRSPLLNVTWQENGETRRAADLRWRLPTGSAAVSVSRSFRSEKIAGTLRISATTRCPREQLS